MFNEQAVNGNLNIALFKYIETYSQILEQENNTDVQTFILQKFKLIIMKC